MRRALSRRQLVASALAAAVNNLAAGSAEARADFGGRAPVLHADPFALGVASGDPGHDGIVLWTRIVGEHREPLEAPRLSVIWEVAEDEEFRRVVRSGRRTATSSLGHAMHVDVRGLRPGRPYWYRFQAAGATSPTGALRTIPPDPQSITIALTSCQHWEQGWFSGYADMASADPDVIVHVGDYIYEKSFGTGPNVRQFASDDPRTLDAYRARHALYKSDPDLQRAHAAAPWIVSFDDHEVENDYAGVAGVQTTGAAEFVRRRAAAYQAYFEHMPVKPNAWQGNGVRLHRRTSYGDLAKLVTLDTRQYRSTQVCGGDVRGARQITRCADLEDPARTMLGVAQEDWFERQMRKDEARWTLVAQQSLFSQINLSASGEETVWSDLWDGYPAARARATDSIAAGANVIILGGDVHSFWINDVREAPSRQRSPMLATEIVTTCLASRNAPASLFAYAVANNEHVRYMDNAHAGYVLMHVTPDRVAVDLRAVESLVDPVSQTHSLARFVIEHGRQGATRA